MADTPIKSDIFKFVALRPPVPAAREQQATNFMADSRAPEQTPVGELTRTFNREDGTRIPEQAKDFIQRHGYAPDYPGPDSALTIIYALAKSIDAAEFDLDNLKASIGEVLGKKIPDWLESDTARETLNNLWDRYYSFLILSRTEPVSLEQLTNNLRVFHLLANIVKLKNFTYSALQDLLAAKPVISKLFTDLPKPAVPAQRAQSRANDPARVEQYKNLWAQLVDTHRAIDEIRNVRFETNTEIKTTDLIIPNRDTGREGKTSLSLMRNNLLVSQRSIDALHNNTKQLIGNVNLQSRDFQPIETITQLQGKLEGLYRAASSIEDLAFFEMMPLEAKSIAGLLPIAAKKVIDLAPFISFQPPTNIRPFIKPLGVGDLKVVKQTLKKYVAGEVAHIENVLRGEYKERKHRVLDRTEDILSVTNETDEETTKDTQTTERFELKKESEKAVQEQMSVQAGVTVSGSYGMVTFGAHGDFAYSTASTESNKSSSNFAREVIDKSVSRIQKKTKEERTTKKLHEVEELNTHGIDNKGQPDHAVGIYRWVDKYYEAQIYNYGKRMMFEFIIPEPAAFWEFAQEHKPRNNILPPKALADNITHRNITTENYQDFIRAYNVQGILPPPLPFRTISTSIVKEGMPLDGNGHAITSKELVVPAGYISKAGLWWDCSAVWSHWPIIEVTIGNKIFRPLEIPRTDGNFDARFSMGNNHDRNDIPFHWFWPESPIQVSVNSYDVLSFTINVYGLCERTWEAYEQWQMQAFEKIMAAYNAMQAEYEQKLAAQETVKGIAITGQNPRINRVIEKTELKKQCVKLLMDTYLFGSFDAMKNGGNDPPDFDIFDALGEGKVIQFFEQAFEWENLTYLFYPYFWARKDQWMHKSSIYDEDPLFTQFRQAGSARVVLPVHPAYNDAVMYFLENNGTIWNGGEPPHLNDPLFISLAEELRNQTDDLAHATAEGEPWEVILPTTLVHLQADAVLPTFP
jgi:hypothetical protein